MKKIIPGIPKYLTLVLKIASVFLLLGIVGYFSLRGYFLNKAIEKIQNKLAIKYNTRLWVREAGFKGFTTVSLKGIQLIPNGKDTLLSVDEFSLSIKFWYALLADIRINEVSLSNGYLQLVKKGNDKNFDQFYKQKGDTSSVQSQIKEPPDEEKVNYARVIYNLIVNGLNKVPNKVTIHHFTLKGIDDNHFLNLGIIQLSMIDKKLSSVIQVQSSEVNQQWQFSGLANPGERQADITFSRLDQGNIVLPYLLERFNLKVGFNSLRLQLNNVSFDDDELRINGSASIDSFMVDHAKISKRDVMIPKAKFDYAYVIGSNYISLDSSTSFVFNDFTIHPFIKFQNGPDTIFYLSVRTEKTEAQKFINALPEGLFSHVKGMEATGSFSYRLDFIYNENHPNDMVFESKLEKDKLKITRYGEANLSKLNNEFTYLPTENGRSLRPVFVGLANPYYTPLDQISTLLKKTVLTTEDPSFYWHHGFVTEAFRQSIVKNIRTGRFKRGASTLSMQLTKNVFLTREKTISRKLEEILLVFILENNYICTKDRMFEVYLNIIEWGPDVYGIGEASQFYFNKKPIDLTLSESLFLATIIPGPKHFMWRFGKDGTPKPFLERTYRFLSNLMIIRNLLIPEDTLGLTHKVVITGPARKYIIKNDSLVNDTLIEQELELLHNPGEREED